MKFFYLLFAGFLLPFASLAQANYHQGYVVLSSGDTVRGYINTREWDRTPKNIEFKTNLASASNVVYTPSHIKSFEVTGIDKFITYLGSISMDTDDPNNIPMLLDTTQKQDTIFLKYAWVGSNVSLLIYKDKLKTRFFAQETGQQPFELSYHLYMDESYAAMHTTSAYRNQLVYLAQKYGADAQAISYISRIDYKISDLQQSMKYLNRVQLVRKSVAQGRFFIGGGITQQTTAFYGDNQFVQVGKYTLVSPYISAGYDFFQNPSVQQFIFRAEVNASYNSPHFSRTAFDPNPGRDETMSYQLKQFTIGVIPQILYNVYNTDALKLYINVGVGFNISSYNSDSYTNTLTNQENRKGYYDLQNVWVNFPLKAGVFIRKKIELYGQFTYRSAFSQQNNYSIQTQSIGGGFHYCF